jgi:hypothetical protein
MTDPSTLALAQFTPDAPCTVVLLLDVLGRTVVVPEAEHRETCQWMNEWNRMVSERARKVKR